MVTQVRAAREAATEARAQQMKEADEALTAARKGFGELQDTARPPDQFRVPLFAARTPNATGQSRVTLSLR